MMRFSNDQADVQGSATGGYSAAAVALIEKDQAGASQELEGALIRSEA